MCFHNSCIFRGKQFWCGNFRASHFFHVCVVLVSFDCGAFSHIRYYLFARIYLFRMQFSSNFSPFLHRANNHFKYTLTEALDAHLLYVVYYFDATSFVVQTIGIRYSLFEWFIRFTRIRRYLQASITESKPNTIKIAVHDQSFDFSHICNIVFVSRGNLIYLKIFSIERNMVGKTPGKTLGKMSIENVDCWTFDVFFAWKIIVICSIWVVFSRIHVKFIEFHHKIPISTPVGRFSVRIS